MNDGGTKEPVGLSKSLTGITGLDDITQGGLPTGRPTLLCGGPGCGKTLFAMTFLVNGAARFGETGVFMSFEEAPHDLAENVASLAYDVDGLIAGKKLLIDHVRVEKAEIEESGEYDLEALFVRLGYAIDQIGAKRVVLDTIEALFSGSPIRPCCAGSCAACSPGSRRRASPRSSRANAAKASLPVSASRNMFRTA
jgi:circadian clock protein KaiC